ncbi:hypothetical protein [Alicyclobacillus pomorum]|uniref:hypothetical protein n=1 Tax=Alicyclobacillus pomorum TaxID=204470 RepID=UPI000427A20B|nr:hypothetical protein [Alicyclobacillus pomorum]
MNIKHSGNAIGQAQPNAPFAPFDLISREELKRLAWDEGHSDADIATMYGVTANKVHEKRRKMNLIHGQITSEQLSEIVRLAETIKSLPLEAIEEIQDVVRRYTN